mgnify:CR=1 FL=1
MMASSFSLTLPLPPSVNRLYTGQGVNKRLTPQHSAWRSEAGWRMNEARGIGGGVRSRGEDEV